MRLLPAKDIEELVPVTFDFSPALADGATVTPQAVTVEVYRGTDANTAALLYGAPIASGASVVQWISGGLDGVRYKLRCRVATSGGQVLVLAARLSVTRF